MRDGEGRLVAGRYAVLRELGRGGIGVVWRAEDRMIGREVALKELRIPPGLSGEEHDRFVERVLREARTAGRLSDPAIVTVYDVVPEDDAMFIVMELVEAPTLAEVVARSGALPAHRVVDIGLRVLSALSTAHAAGIVHRDVKPSNIMVLPNDQVKLADFGIAQAMDDPSLTATGGTMGSPGYMAPELFRGEPPSPASDLWSLGATLFHAAEGRAPFQRGTTAATMHAIMYEEPRLEHTRGSLAGVLAGLLAQSPQARPTAVRVREQLTSATPPGTDAEQTVVLEPVTTHVDPDRTTAMDRNLTAVVPRRRRSTRPADAPTADAAPISPPGQPAWGAEWAEEPRPNRRRRRRTALVAGAAVVLVLALVGVAMAMANHGPTASASGSTATGAPHRGQPVASSSAPVSTAVSATPTGTPSGSPTTATASTTGSPQRTGKPIAPPAAAPPVPPPTKQLSYVAIYRYNSPAGYHITAPAGASWMPAGFSKEGSLGYLVSTNEPGTLRFYACRITGGQDYFSSVDQSGRCEGQTVVAMLGYIYYNQPTSGPSGALYRCNSGGSHFDSLLASCEGNHAEGRSGYVI